MPAIGKLHLGGLPRIVLAVDGYAPDLDGAYASGVSVLEARMDLFHATDKRAIQTELERLKQVGLPLLGTFRTRSEGGRWDGNESERKERLLESLAWVDALDIELSAESIHAEVAQACKQSGKTLIVSRHFLADSPPSAVLEGVWDAARGLGADIVKLACLAQSEADVTRLLAFVEAHRGQGVVGISMGPQGGVSRVAAPLFGSLLCYTSRALNYGQLPLETLVACLQALYPAFEQDLKMRRHPSVARVP